MQQLQRQGPKRRSEGHRHRRRGPAGKAALQALLQGPGREDQATRGGRAQLKADIQQPAGAQQQHQEQAEQQQRQGTGATAPLLEHERQGSHQEGADHRRLGTRQQSKEPHRAEGGRPADQGWSAASQQQHRTQQHAQVKAAGGQGMGEARRPKGTSQRGRQRHHRLTQDQRGQQPAGFLPTGPAQLRGDAPADIRHRCRRPGDQAPALDLDLTPDAFAGEPFRRAGQQGVRPVAQPPESTLQLHPPALLQLRAVAEAQANPSLGHVGQGLTGRADRPRVLQQPRVQLNAQRLLVGRNPLNRIRGGGLGPSQPAPTSQQQQGQQPGQQLGEGPALPASPAALQQTHHHRQSQPRRQRQRQDAKGQGRQGPAQEQQRQPSPQSGWSERSLR